MGSSGNRQSETELNLRAQVGAALGAMVDELNRLPEQDEWRTGFEIARRIRTVLFTSGVGWSNQQPDPYEFEVRALCKTALLEFSDTMLQIYDTWDKVRLPEKTDPVQFAFRCARDAPKKAAVFSEDFPDESACEKAILILTALWFLEQFCVQSGTKPFFPTRLLGEALKTSHDSAALFLRTLDRLGYIKIGKAKSKRESPPLSFGRRFHEANLPGGSTGILRVGPDPDKGSEGSDPKETYAPKVDEGSEGPKRVSILEQGGPKSRKSILSEVIQEESNAESPEEQVLINQFRARQQAEQERIEKGQPNPL